MDKDTMPPRDAVKIGIETPQVPPTVSLPISWHSGVAKWYALQKIGAKISHSEAFPKISIPSHIPSPMQPGSHRKMRCLATRRLRSLALRHQRCSCKQRFQRRCCCARRRPWWPRHNLAEVTFRVLGFTPSHPPPHTSPRWTTFFPLKMGTRFLLDHFKKKKKGNFHEIFNHVFGGCV